MRYGSKKLFLLAIAFSFQNLACAEIMDAFWDNWHCHGKDTESSGTDDIIDTEVDSDFCTDNNNSGVCDNVPGLSRVLLHDENNYSFSHSLLISRDVVRGNANFTVDWSGLTQDIMGEPIDPAEDIDLVMITLWSMGPTALAEAISNDDLNMAHNVGAVWVLPDGTYTSAELFSFGPMGVPADPEELLPFFDSDSPSYDPTSFTHLLTAQSGTNPGINIRMIKMFTLDSDSSNMTLSLAPDSTLYSYSVDIHSKERLGIPAAESNITLDWRALITNAMGDDFVPSKIDRVAIGHFLDMTVCDMEASFTSLEQAADEVWSLQLHEVSVDVNLASLVSMNGTQFPGVDATGIWVFAMFCDSCINAAPQFLTVLQPCE